MIWWLVAGVAVAMSIRVPVDAREAWADVTGIRPTTLRLAAGWGKPVSRTSRAVLINPSRLDRHLPPPGPGRKVALLFLFAHELGHSRDLSDDSPADEREADRRAGATLRELGVSQDQIERWVLPMLCATSPSSTHGDPSGRAGAVMDGWAA